MAFFTCDSPWGELLRLSFEPGAQIGGEFCQE
jgi:hypothetical protein